MNRQLQEKSLFDILSLIGKRRGVIFTTIVAANIVTVILTFCLPPIFKSQVQLCPKAGSENVMQDSSNGNRDLPLSQEDTLKSYLGILRGNSVLGKVAEEIQTRTPREIKKASHTLITDDNLLQITVFDKDPETAARIAQAYALNFNDFLAAQSAENLERMRKHYRAQIERISAEIEGKQEELKNIQKSNAAYQVQVQLGLLLQEKNRLESEQRNAEINIHEERARVNHINEQLNQIPETSIAAETFVEDPVIRQLRSEVTQLQLDMSAEIVEKKEKHPDVTMLASRIERAEQELEDQVEMIVSSQTKEVNWEYQQLKSDLIRSLVNLSLSQAKLDAFTIAIGQVADKLNAIPDIETSIGNLNNEIMEINNARNLLKSRVRDLEAQMIIPQKRFMLISNAQVPLTASFPNFYINIAVNTLFAIIFGIFFIFLLEYLGDVRNAVRQAPASKQDIHGEA